MKHLHKLLSIIIAISLLITGSVLPASALSFSDIFKSVTNLVNSDNLVMEDEQLFFDKITLNAEDPEISKESMILKYIDSSLFNLQASKYI